MDRIKIWLCFQFWRMAYADSLTNIRSTDLTKRFFRFKMNHYSRLLKPCDHVYDWGYRFGTCKKCGKVITQKQFLDQWLE